MFKSPYINPLIFMFLFMTISCQLDQIEIEDWSPEVVTPLINTTITIADLIPEEGSTQYGDDQFISLAVKDDSVYVLTPESLITLPNEDELSFEQEFLFSDLSIDDFVQDTTFNLNNVLQTLHEQDSTNLIFLVLDGYGIEYNPFPEETQYVPGQLFEYLNENTIDVINFQLEDFISASFITGELVIEITNNLPIGVENMEIAISTGQGSVGDQPAAIQNLLTGETDSFVIDLSGVSIDNNISFEVLDLTMENVSNDDVPLSQETGLDISFSITNISVNTINMVFENQQLEAETTFFSFDLENGEQVHNLVLSTGQINYSIESSIIAPIKAIISIPSGLDSYGQPFEKIENINLNGGSVNGSISLDGLEVDLTTHPDTPYNYIPFVFEIIVDSNEPVTLSNSDYADINFSFSNLELDYLDGYFATYEVDLGGDTVDVDLGLFDNFDSGLALENPTFAISFQNSFGLEANVIGQLTCYAEDNNIDPVGFQINETIGSPDIVGGAPFESTWMLDEDTLDQMIALPPQIIEYSATASILDQGVLNYMTSDSKFLLGVEINCPLSLSAANISLHDTILFEQLDYDIEKIENLILHFNFINGFPLGTEFNLFLHDSISSVNLDTISFTGINTEDNVIAPATVYSDGSLVPELNSGFFDLDDSEISNFLNSNKIIVDINLSTSNSDNDEYVKIYADYECVLKIGVETKINME